MGQPLKVLELFGGIGACSKALTNLGVEHEIVDLVEIDRFAVASFNAVHGTSFEPQDITKWDKDVEVDLIMHGSPCQDFSMAGRQAGGDEGSGTRSSLMYETIRIVEKLKPKYVIWENVKNLLSEKHRPNFEAYQARMKGLGYKNFVQVLNAKDYGIPQNRERVFTVSIREDLGQSYQFPEPIPLEKKLGDMLEDVVTSAQKDSLIIEPSVKPSVAKNIERESEQIMCSDKDFYTCECTSSYADNKVGLKVSPSLRASNSSTYAKTNSNRVRKLTPKECWRLMGFYDEDFEKAAKVNSNTQLYKQAGNSIVVDVLEAILGNLLCQE